MTSLNFLFLKHRSKFFAASAIGIASAGGLYYQYVQLPREEARKESEKRRLYSAHEYVVQRANQGDPESNLLLVARKQADENLVNTNDSQPRNMTPLNGTSLTPAGSSSQEEVEPFRFDVSRDGLRQSMMYLLEAKKAEEDYMTRDMRTASKEVQRAYIQRFKEIRQERNDINAMLKRLQQR